MKAALILALFLATAVLASVLPPFAFADSIQVIFERGDTLQARCVEPAPFDMLRITTPDDDFRYVPTVRIRAVTDTHGEDRTADVLNRRETLGTPLPKEIREAAPPKLPRVGPRSVTRSFAITETSLLGRVHRGDLSRADLAGYIGFDAGWMKNVAAKTAIGGSAFFGSGNEYVNGGGRFRIRHWLSRTSSLEIAPGIIAMEGRTGWDALSPGYSVQGSWSPSRFVTLTTEAFTVRRRGYPYAYVWAAEPHQVRENGVLLGIKVGQWPGAAAGIIAALSFALQMGLPGSYGQGIP